MTEVLAEDRVQVRVSRWRVGVVCCFAFDLASAFTSGCGSCWEELRFAMLGFCSLTKHFISMECEELSCSLNRCAHTYLTVWMYWRLRIIFEEMSDELVNFTVIYTVKYTGFSSHWGFVTPIPTNFRSYFNWISVKSTRYLTFSCRSTKLVTLLPTFRPCKRAIGWLMQSARRILRMQLTGIRGRLNCLNNNVLCLKVQMLQRWSFVTFELHIYA